MEHTPTPWKVSERDWYIISNRGHICEMMGPFGYDVNKANASRIAACVNACEGIPTEVLEALPLNFKQHAIEFEILKAQNARLLEALKELVNATSDDFAAAYGFEVERNNAFKIIAEAEKTTAT